MKPSPTYKRLTALCSAMVNESSASKRRASLTSLLGLLGDKHIRRRIAKEAIPERGSTPNPSAVRHRALSEMWKYIIQSLLKYVEDVVNRKKSSKLKSDDIEMATRIISVAVEQDDGIDAESREYLPQRIFRKESKMILNLCLELLADDEALAVAEYASLGLLNKICKRREIVCHMSPVPDMDKILGEIEGRLLSDPDEDPASHLHGQIASEALQALLKNASALGIGLHLLVPGTIKMVFRWLKRQWREKRIETAVEFLPIVDSLQILIRHHPHQAVRPLVRHGEIILGLVKKKFLALTSNLDRRVFVDFFHSYLIVSQVAGSLEGKMDGEIGSLGPATFGLDDMVEVLGHLIHLSATSSNNTSGRDDRPGQSEEFELMARLLVCCQRQYLVEHGWGQIDASVFIPEYLEASADPYDLMNARPVSQPIFSYTTATLLASPVMLFVIGKLARPCEMEDSPDDSLRGALFSAIDTNPTLGNAWLRTLLMLVTAACEVSPSGACWAISADTGWRKVDDQKSEGYEPLFVQMCRPDDLSIVVDSVIGVVEAHGDSEGDPIVQKASLVCLTHLIISSWVVRLNAESSQSYDSLEASWRRVWRCLLGSNWQYHTFIEDNDSDSLGYLVLQCLTLLVRSHCADSPGIAGRRGDDAFTVIRQSDIWNLPIFQRPDLVSSTVLFDLISALVLGGLTEHGPDKIISQQEEQHTSPSSSRRFRLAQFCLTTLSGSKDRHFLGAVSCTVAILTNGTSNLSPEGVDHVGIGRPLRRELKSVTHISCGEECGLLDSIAQTSSFLSTLWVDISSASVKSVTDDLVEGRRMSKDPVSESIERLLGWATKKAGKAWDFGAVSKSESKAIREYCMEYSRRTFNNAPTQGDICGELRAVTAKAALLQLILSFVVTSCGDELSGELETEASSTFQDCGLYLASGKILLQEAEAILRSLVPIASTIISFFSQRQREYSSSLVYGANVLSESCRSLLDKYSPDKSSSTDPSFDSDTDDDECQKRASDSVFHGPAKKKSRLSEGAHTQSPHLESPSTSPFQAFLLSALVLSINPSLNACEFVVTKLCLTSSLDTLQDGDLLGSLRSLILVSQDSCLQHAVARDVLMTETEIRESDSSSVALILSLVRCIRRLGASTSCFYKFGYRFCGQLVRTCRELVPSIPFNEKERETIVEMLCDDTQMAKYPSIRAERLLSATLCFRFGDDNLREDLAKPFRRIFIVPSIGDVDSNVREHARIAIVTAMEILSQEKVVSSVTRLLPDIVGDHESEDPYQNWYSTKELCPKLKDTTERQVWEDIRNSIVLFSVQCLGSMIGVSRNQSVVRALVFKLISNIWRIRWLEAAAYREMLKAVQVQGFTDFEDFIETERESLAREWLQTQRDPLEMPWLMAAPRLLLLLIECGGMHIGLQEGIQDSDNLQRVAASAHISRRCRTYLPIALEMFSSRTVQESVTREIRRSLLEDENVRAICLLFYDNFDDGVVAKVLRDHIRDILAHSLSLSVEGSKKEPVALEMVRLLKSLFQPTFVDRQRRLQALEIICRSLRIACTQGNHSPKMLAMAMRNFLADLGEKSSPLLGVLTDVGGTTHDIALLCRLWLRQAKGRRDMLNYWTIFEALGEFLVANLGSDGALVQLISLCSLLSRLLLQEGLLPIREKVLLLIENLFDKAITVERTGSVTRGALEDLFRDSLATLLYVHESSQLYVAEKAQYYHMNREWSLRRSVGLVDGIQYPGSYLRDLRQTISKPDDACAFQINLLRESYRVLLLLLDKARYILAETSYFVGLLPPYRAGETFLSALLEIDTKFCAQDEIKNILTVTTVNLGPHVLRVLSTDLKSGALSRHLDVVAPNTVEERLLLVELRELNSFLRVIDVDSISTHGLNVLMKNLSSICETGSTEAVRLASSRCFGAMSSSALAADDEATLYFDDLQRSIQNNDVVLFLQSQCLAVLWRCLRLRDEKTSVVAKETLVAVAPSVELSNYEEYLDKSIIEGLRPILCSGVNRKPKQALIKANKLRNTNGSYQNTTKEWCYSERVWEGGVETPGDVWLTEIVPALLEANYATRRNDSNRKDGCDVFLGACQQISALAPDFAETLFPLLILDLLGYCDTIDPAGRQERGPSPFNIGNGNPRRIQICLNSFLRRVSDKRKHEGAGGIAPPDQRSTRLIVDTLDLVRRLAQHGFVQSESKKHDQGVSGRDLKGIEARKKSPLNICIEGFDWKHMAISCVSVKRFASGLFYLEHFAEDKLGGSTDAFASGEGGADLGAERSAVIATYSLALKALGEDEEKAVVDCFASELGFADVGQKFLWSALGLEDHSSLVPVQVSDCISAQGTSDSIKRLINDLAGVGLPQTMKLAITGAATECESLDVDSRNELRERWFESSVNDLNNWDECFQSKQLQTLSRLEGTTAPDSLKNDSCGKACEGGFYESIAKITSSILVGDEQRAQDRMRTARIELASITSSRITRESKFLNNQAHLEYFRVLDDIESTLNPLGSFTNVVATNFPALDDMNPLSVTERNRQVSNRQLGVRELLLRIAQAKAQGLEEKIQAKQSLLSLLWTSCRSSQTQESERALHRLFKLLETSHNRQLVDDEARISTCRLRLQEAKIIHDKGDFIGAIRQVKQVIHHLAAVQTPDDATRTLQADSNILCGQWMIKQKVESATNVLSTYLCRGSEIAKGIHDAKPTPTSAKLAATAFLAQASVLCSLFDSVSTRVQSLEWENAGNMLDNRKEELAKCTELIKEKTPRGKARITAAENELKSTRIYAHQLAKSIEIASEERGRIESSVETYRKEALKAIVEGLIVAEPTHKGVTRFVYQLIHLWFTSGDACEDDSEFSEIVDRAVINIPSFRFVTVSSQLLSTVEVRASSQFQLHLHKVVEKICREHPYHCLIQLLSLANGKNVGTGVSGRNATAFLENAKDEKIKGAKELLVALGKDKALGGLIESYRALSVAYVHLAMYPTANLLKQKTKSFHFSATGKNSSERLDQCLGRGSRAMPYPPCILTKPPPIRPYGDYLEKGEITGAEQVKEFEPVFTMTDSGLHRPKIVVCRGSRGGRFKQLVKGEDEIRQDAVMEQVFDFVNNLIRFEATLSPQEQRHPLKLVTYNIVPLSPVCGVLEWVDQTVAFGDFLMDRKKKNGGHSRHCPAEWTNEVCRQKLRAVSKASRAKRRQVFDEICANHSPVYRYFFIERFGHSPADWHAAKMRFSRSVAINSVVGHILGIGDRHCSNILIHQGSGEVVHIDFGIVFEQGKLLATPELVPFRLTRNIVDGFGPVGVNGSFLSAAKRTLSILRKNSNSIMTILSAIKSDPLYTWSISPVRQDDEENFHLDDKDDANTAAEHAIRRVQEKLQGYEDGTAGEQQSIQGQIQLLISCAMDRDKLCQMFPGWQPWS